jgi:ABC-type phosphate transport system permease subunit
VISWAVRLLLIAAGTVTSWFVAKDAPGFGVVQMMVATLLVALVVAVIAFWPARWAHRLDRLNKSQ